jgi:small subunit ribosomal protein S4
MARYIGPKTKNCQKIRRSYLWTGPNTSNVRIFSGQHGLNKKRRKLSEYGTQLQENKKQKYTYGILERQFENLFHKAQRTKGITGEVMLQLLESRLDNVVIPFRNSPYQGCCSPIGIA